MTILKYEIFKTIVEVGSLSKTAEKLNMTQSGVSYAISKLEDELGFVLLKRDRSGVNLTSNGERILKHVRSILEHEELLRKEAASISKVNTGTVRIGTLSSVSTRWLPGILSQFHKTHPRIEVKTYQGCYDEMDEWISNGTVDFGFLSLPTSKSFDLIPLRKDKLVVVLPADHPLRHEKVISFAQLENQPFIMPQWGNDDIIKRSLNENKVKLQIQYELMEEQTILQMVQMGLGITILPELILVNVPENVQMVDLENPNFRIIGIAALSLKNLPPAAKTFIDCIRSWLGEHNFLDY